MILFGYVFIVMIWVSLLMLARDLRKPLHFVYRNTFGSGNASPKSIWQAICMAWEIYG